MLSLACSCFKGIASQYLPELIPHHEPARPLGSLSQSCLHSPSVDERCMEKTVWLQSFSTLLLGSGMFSCRHWENAVLPTVFCRQLKTNLFSAECLTGQVHWLLPPISPPPPICLDSALNGVSLIHYCTVSMICPWTLSALQVYSHQQQEINKIKTALAWSV